MEDGSGTPEQAEVCRQDLYEDYVKCYLQLCPEVRPCRDAGLLERAAQYLLREPESRGTFTVFPFRQAVRQEWSSMGAGCREHMCALIKATELLETLCVSLFLQPWRKEIRTLKTFTGPFVYCLLPVFSSSTIQSVLASIGYLPHTDTPQSEYRLSEGTNPERAMLLGFELLLARVECYHLLELLEKDQPEQQEWLEILQRRVGPTEQEEPTEKKTAIGQNGEEKRKKKKKKKEEEEETDGKEVPLYIDTRLAVKPQPKPESCHLISLDQSIMEMQMTYPDLAFRGRPLLTDKPQRANSSKSRSKDDRTTNTNNCSEASELPQTDCIKGPHTDATRISSGHERSRADEVFGGDGRGSDCKDRSSSSSMSNTDGSRVIDELSGPQAISLHITLRAGSKAEPSLKCGESQPTAELPARTQQQNGADLENKRPANPKLPSLSSMDEEQELRELAERMGQLSVQETKEEVERKDEANANKERRKEERQASTEGEAEEQNLRKIVMETGQELSHAAIRCTGSSQSDRADVKEQKQLTVCHHSLLSISTAECQSYKGGQQEGEDAVRADTGRGEEEQLAQSFAIVEHHKK